MKLEGDNFRQKLNTQHIFDDWVTRVQAKNISLTGRIFIIEKRQKDGRILLNLKVNFSSDIVTLFKEVTLVLNTWMESSIQPKNVIIFKTKIILMVFLLPVNDSAENRKILLCLHCLT